MPSAKLLIGGAAATAALGIRVARSIYGRWQLLPEPDRQRIELLAEDLKQKAFELRGAPDRAAAEEDLRAANETLAAALVETAEASSGRRRGRGARAARGPAPRARATGRCGHQSLGASGDRRPAAR